MCVEQSDRLGKAESEKAMLSSFASFVVPSIVAENENLRAQVKSRWTEGQLIGKSPAMDRLRELVKRVAGATTSVLIARYSGNSQNADESRWSNRYGD